MLDSRSVADLYHHVAAASGVPFEKLGQMLPLKVLLAGPGLVRSRVASAPSPIATIVSSPCVSRL